MTTTQNLDEVPDGVTDHRPTMSSRARSIALLCLMAAAFMELMDATVVNVALRTMGDDLGLSAAALQWIAAGYPLAYAVGLILGARLGDRFGRRRLFIMGLAAFGIASMACGLAADPGQLVAFRLIQGAAAALMVPQVLTSIQVMYPPSERGTAMGMFTSVIGLAAVAGPILGGVITAGNWFDLAWRPIFLINVPIAVVAIIAAVICIPESRAERPAPIVASSALLLGGGLAALMVPITLGPENDWPMWGFGLGAAGIALLAVFAWRQFVTARTGVEPMVPPDLFRTRSFAAGVAAFAATMVPTGGFFLIQSLHVQHALGWSVLRTGMMWIPFSLAVSVAAGVSAAKLAGAFGPIVLRVGAVVFGIGMATMTVAEGSAHPGLWFAVTLVIAGIGFGGIVGSAGLLILNDVPVALAGAASGVFNTVQAAAVAPGGAVVGTISSSVAGSDGLSSGYRAGMFVMMALVLVGAVVSLAMPKGAPAQPATEQV